MPFKGRGRSWINGRTSLMRWCVRLWQMSPHMKWKTNREIHKSYITTSCSSLCPKLVFPCMWMFAKYRTDVPAPPQSGLLPEGETARLRHKKIMVWQSPSIRLGRPPWVDKWEAMVSPRDINWSIHRRWAKIPSDVKWLWMWKDRCWPIGTSG